MGSEFTKGDLFKIALFVFIVGLFIFLGISIRIVSPGEVTVATRFGTLLDGQRAEGLYVEPFTGYTTFSTRVLLMESEETSATKDLQDVNINAAFSFRIPAENVRGLYLEVGDLQNIKLRIIRPAISSTVKSVTTTYNAEGILTKRSDMENQVLASLKEELEPYGIEVTQFAMTNLSFPNEEFNQAIDRKQIAEQQALEEKFNLESAKLQAEQQEVQKQSLTPAILQKMWIEKWNGVLPSTYAGDEQLILQAK